MPLVVCPACSARLKVAAAGAEVTCPKCAWRWTPGADAADEPPRGAVHNVALVAGLVLLASLAVLGIIVGIRLGQNIDAARQAFGRVGETIAHWGAALSALAFVFCIVAYVPFCLWAFCWVARDADSRGHSGAAWAVIYGVPQLLAMWSAILTLILIAFGVPFLFLACGWVGMVLYLSSRRPGRLVRCRHCPNRKLDYAAVCPHCGRAAAVPPVAAGS